MHSTNSDDRQTMPRKPIVRLLYPSYCVRVRLSPRRV